MKTTYTIIHPAIPVTKQQIAKAKKLFNKAVERGEVYRFANVEIVFYYSNNVVSCDYVNSTIGIFHSEDQI